MTQINDNKISMKEDYWEEKIDLKKRMLEKYSKKEYIKDFAAWLVDAIEFGTKYDVDHDLDPPYDSSGRLVEVGSFNIDDYETVSDFFNEYTGQTEASYMSGCGFFHKTYDSEWDDFTSELSNKIFKEVISDIARENKTIYLELLEEIEPEDSEVFDEIQEFFCDFIYEFSSEILSNIEDMKVSDLYEIDKEYIKVRRKRQAEANEKARKETEYRRKIIEKEKEQVAIIWERLKELYRKEFDSDLKDKIVKSTFPPFKTFLDTHFSKEEQRLIVTYYSHMFSNSVRPLIHKI